MSKKQKRRVSQSAAQAVGIATEKPVSKVVNSSTVQARVRSSIYEFKPDYTFVYRDIKRIGTLAGSFFVILIILSFIIK
jgi:hypothetical protein